MGNRKRLMLILLMASVTALPREELERLESLKTAVIRMEKAVSAADKKLESAREQLQKNKCAYKIRKVLELEDDISMYDKKLQVFQTTLDIYKFRHRTAIRRFLLKPILGEFDPNLKRLIAEFMGPEGYEILEV